MRVKLRLARNTLMELLVIGFNMVSGLFLAPYLLKNLGLPLGWAPERRIAEYGLWTLIASVTNYFGYLDFGVRPAVSRLIAGYRGKGDIVGINATITTALGMLGLSALAAMIGSVAFAPLFPHIFHLDMPSPDVAATVMWVGLTLAINFPLSVFDACLIAHERNDLSAGTEIIATLVRFSVTVYLVHLGSGILALAQINFMVLVGSGLIKLLLVRRVFPAIRVTYALYDRQIAKSVYRYGFWFFLQIVAARISALSDNITVGIFIGTSAVAVYSFALRLIAIARESGHSLANAVYPLAAGHDARGELHKQQRLLMITTQASLGFALLVATFFLGYGGEILSAWIGTGLTAAQIHQSVVVLFMLTIPTLGVLTQQTNGAVIQGVDGHRILAYLLLGEAVISTAISVALAPRLGMVGIASGTLIAVSISNYFIQPIFVCRQLKLPLGQYFRLVHGPVLLKMTPVCAALCLLRLVWVPDGRIAVALLGLGGGLCYLSIFYRLFFTKRALSHWQYDG